MAGTGTFPAKEPTSATVMEKHSSGTQQVKKHKDQRGQVPG